MVWNSSFWQETCLTVLNHPFFAFVHVHTFLESLTESLRGTQKWAWFFMIRIAWVELCNLSVTMGTWNGPWPIWCQLTQYKSAVSVWLWEHKLVYGCSHINWMDNSFSLSVTRPGTVWRKRRFKVLIRKASYFNYSAVALFVILFAFIFHTCLLFHWLVASHISGIYI